MHKWFNLMAKFKKTVFLSLAVVLISGFFVIVSGVGQASAVDLPVSKPYTTPTPDPTSIFMTDKPALSAYAQLYAKQEEQKKTSIWGTMKDYASKLKDWAREDLWNKVVLQGGSKALGSAITSALNTIAMDTATWLGSGGNGQKPLFYTEGWGTYLTNIADNAAGTFVEQLGKQNGYAKFNLCKPNFALQMKIGLGLVQSVKPSTPACTFTKLVDNWETELTSEDFMDKIQTSFDPTGNDFGVAFSLQTGMFEKINEDKYQKLLTRQEGQGWINQGTDKIAGSLGIPGEQQRKAYQINQLQVESIGKYTGYALIDAANVFINQLAITAFNELMKKLGGKSDTSSYGNWSSLISNYSAGPDATISGGIAATKNQLRKIVEPKFNVRGDYNILSELSSCPKPDKAGPTNCVIDDKFKQAILEKKTVAEAIKQGYLNGDKIVGYSAKDLEPRYTDGYPYRSLLILRKFRILPVGWEIASQYIRDNIDSAILPNGVGVKTLSDLVACYDQNDEHAGYYANWCQGLVDPNWVLKAPLNYCRREGPGPENIADDDSTLVRNDKYCADEQSCIKEKNDGSCEFYGYCTEERRKWKFNTDSCEPLNNSCQTFKKEDGASVSYLKNTLNYSGCSVDNAGCTDYCTAYNFSTGKYTCTATSTGDKVFLDRDAGACDAKSEGCTSFIRTKDGLGANLLLNSSFEEDLAIGSWSALGATSSDAFSGLSSLRLTPGILTKNFIAGPGLTFAGGEYNIEGEAYSVSFYSKNCPAGSSVSFKDGANTETAEFLSTGNWQLASLSHIFLSSGPTFDLEFNTPAGSSCLIDAIKLEKSTQDTPYSEYASAGLIHEKFAPSYLGCDGVADPVECKDFTRSCKYEEVGCELYTPATGGMPVPGKVKPGDYCVAECVGFDTYLQSQTVFDSLRPDYFIPKTAKSCSAEANGCDQFTNLDKLGSGAEATEYYSYLRQCITSGGSQFYTWEGSDETGFQLKVVTLKPDVDADDVPLDLDGNPVTPNIADYVGDPAITGSRSQEVAKCNEKIYQLQQTDPGYNADCREYYNAAGVKSYHLYSQTISEDANCHPYRRTEVNIDPAITDIAACVGADKNWNAATNECAVCLNGGTWNAQQGACIYQAIPGEGMQCSAQVNGCREYTGNTGQSVKVISNSDLEDSTLQGWIDFNGAAAPTLSTESVNMGGHSIRIQTNANNQGVVLPMSTSTMVTGSSYAVTLIAKTRTPVTLKVRATNAAAASVDFVGIGSLSADWQMYRANLSEMTITDPKNLIIEADVPAEFFIDNIKLSEISNRFYLIKNSWNTPETCNQDMNKKPYPLYMLGCNEYKDRDNLTYYLRSFSYLCGEGSVGCELMIDVHNSATPRSETFNNTNVQAADDVTVPADNYLYAVYDKKKLCQAENVGCQRLGKPYAYQNERLYSDIYLKNNPDNYKTAMCDYEGLSCGEYLADSGSSFFKNPGDATCEWRPGAKNVFGWYKKKVKRCNAVGALCSQDSDCASPQTCQEIGDIPCPTDVSANPKTFGVGTGQRTEQPASDTDGNWVGVCPAEESSCTEYIDPQSTFSQNLLFNNTFAQNVNVGDEPNRDGWPGNAQGVTLEKNTLYILAGTGNAGSSVTISGCMNESGPAPVVSNISRLSAATNALIPPTTLPQTLMLGTSPVRTSMSFYSNNSDTCTISVVPAGLITNLDIELRKAIVDYQLSKNIDTSGCNGLVDNSQGCVLFNQRAKDGSALAALGYDADVSSSTPAVGVAADRDSNTLIKVVPDRTCNQWLACRSSVSMKDQDGNEKNICLDIGLCNQFDYKGGCKNFIEKGAANQTYNYPNLGGGLLSSAQVANISGYTKVGKNEAGKIDAQLPLGSMVQRGASANVYNGNMEMAGDNGYPTGWKFYAPLDTWDEKSFRVINDAAAVQNEGVGSAPEGNGIMKLGVKHEITSNTFTVKVNERYILQASVNTSRLKGDNVGDRVHMKFVCDGNIVPAGGDAQVKTGETWLTVMTGSVLTPAGCTRAAVRFAVDGGMEGSYYVDDVKIKPVLESRSNEYTTQSCRLYPKSEAQSCQYQDTTGIRYNGWYGYCLEYDRYPGLNDACLLWWPTEKISGDPFTKENTFKGYEGKFPAYYCAELDGNFRYVEKRQAGTFYAETQTKSTWVGDLIGALTFVTMPFTWPITLTLSLSGVNVPVLGLNSLNETSIQNGWCPAAQPLGNGSGGQGYVTAEQYSGWSCNGWLCASKSRNHAIYCLPSSKKYSVPGGAQENDEWGNGGWYEFNGSLIKWKSTLSAGSVDKTSEIDNSVKILDMNQGGGGIDGVLVDPKDYEYLTCKKFFQTVSDTGENKVWLGRLAEDSEYKPLGLDYKYTQDSAPYGSAVPPEPINNPYDWDTNQTKPGRQQMSYLLPSSNQVRAGSPYRCIGGKCGRAGYCKNSGNTCINMYCNNDPCSSATDMDVLGYGTKPTSECYMTKQTMTVFPGGSASVVTGNPSDVVSIDPVTGATTTSWNLSTLVSTTQVVAATTTVYTGVKIPGQDCQYNLLDVATTTNSVARSWQQPSYGCDYQEECIVEAASPPRLAGLPTTPSSTENLKRMFAKNYGVWEWNPLTRHYEKTSVPGENWDVNTDAPPCPAGPRPVGFGPDYCRVQPTVSNILLDKSTVHGGSVVKLTFNSKIDVNQLPLVYYRVDWGDGSSPTVITGEFSDRPNADNPHVLYHYYSYTAVQGCAANPCPLVIPKVMVMDNWGSESVTVNGPGIQVFVN